MTSVNRPARLNRILLAITGLVLLAVGGFTLATHAGWLRMLDPDSPLVPGTEQPPTWVLYTATVVAVLVGLLCLRWLATQLARRPKTHTWRLEHDPDRGRTELAAATAVAPLIDEVGGYPGVHSARATLTGTQQAPALALVIATEHDADLTDIRQQLHTHALPRLRQALDLDTVAVTIEFRFTSHTGPRTH
ncbi:alkaline shock response membrane anchor protein AmaP [Amycolatopsis anabasis]|uniref:alkaline shock response membrane anchor protein AmaP n=1 Tax=Amycolatopsis anabasis TaxID=1840409 RepID=UPI00131C20E5|nr:alkaline shock response membrane anchor protein AmaP [Amycolatopsis anabasis]